MDYRLINDTSFTLDNMRSNLMNVRSGIRAYGWEKIQKLINERGMFIPDPRVQAIEET